MKDGLTRRQMINAGVAMGLGSLSARLGHAENVVAQPAHPPGRVEAEPPNDSRWQSDLGGPPNSDQYSGKLVTGFRQSGIAPVMVETPDMEKVP